MQRARALAVTENPCSRRCPRGNGSSPPPADRPPLHPRRAYAYVNPVIAVLLGMLVVGERFSALQIVGGAMVLVAVVLVIAAERPRKRRGVLAASSP